MKIKNKKIFLEEIFNTKIFNIKFISMKLPKTKILSNLQRGLYKEGGLDNFEYDNYINSRNQTRPESGMNPIAHHYNFSRITLFLIFL